MGKHFSADDDWSWWPGEADGTRPSHPEDEEEREVFIESVPGTIVPAAPPYFDRPLRGDQPLERSKSSRQAERQRRLIRIVAPLLMLGLVALLVVVIRLPDAASAQPTITQSSSVNVSSASPAADIQAYIVGEVVHPGVYALHSGDRVDALLQAAGGPKPDADLARVNLAAVVTDGEEVFVPAVGQPLPSGLGGGGGSGPGKVNINTASAEDMHTLLPISLTTCNKIVAYREAHGPYTAITQLLNVMSRTTYDKIKDLITV
ncbi:MAG TPA: ComEA family DNA-binding protein [Ktedonobacterales bacterium]|nr:ComEA family DNA-binding protein [Ktedonobacterales bacterium]